MFLNINNIIAGYHTLKVEAVTKDGRNSFAVQKSINKIGDIELGIDVSVYQKTIDWNKVKKDGISFAIIRAGFRGGVTPNIVEDKNFEANYAGAINNGIKCGIYFYSQAINEEEAIEEATFIVNKLKGKNIVLPIAIDVESLWFTNDDGSKFPSRATLISKEQRTKICKAFCDVIRNAGYTPMIYSNKSWLENEINMLELANNLIWLAHYTGDYNSNSTYKGVYKFWQYTSKGTVNGIEGYVDRNVYYK